MADDTDAEILITANIESLQKGVDAGEALIETLTDKINALNTALGTVGSAGAPALLAELEQVKTELAAAQSLTTQLASSMAGIKISPDGAGGLQSYINDTHRLGEEINSASASSRTMSSTLGMQGVSATEAAIQEKELAAATQAAADAAARSDFGSSQARGREQVTQTISALNGEKTAVDKITLSTSVLAAEWAKVKSVQNSVSGKAFFEDYNRSLGIGVKNTEEITKKTSMFAGTANSAFGGVHVQTAGVTREIIVLAHEMTVGNFSRVPGSLMVLTERFGGLSFATLGWFAALGVTAGVVGYFTVRAIELSNAVKNLQIGAEFSSNAQISNAAIESTIVELAKMHGQTRETAEGVVNEFIRMRNMSGAELYALSMATGEFARATGKDAKQAASELTGILEKENLSTKDLLHTFPGLTDAQLEGSRAALQNGNENERAAAMMNLLQDNLDKTRESQIRANAGMFDSTKNFATYLGLLESGIPYQQIENELIAENSKKWDANAEALRKAAAAKAKQPLTREQKLTAADQAGDQEDPTGLSIASTKRHIEQLKTGIESLHSAGGVVRPEDVAHVERLNHQLAEANAHLTQLTHKDNTRLDLGTRLAGEEQIRQTRELNAQVLADTKISTEQQHEIISANWKRLLDEGKLTASQRKEVETSMWSATGAAARAGSTLTIEEARVSVAAITADETKGSADRLAAIVAVWAKVRDNDKLAYQQRLQAAIEYYKADAALDRENQKEKLGIAKSDAETSRQLSRINIQQEREDTQELWKEHKLSSDQRVQILTNLLKEEEALNLSAIDDEMSLLTEGTAAYQDAANKKKIIAAQTEAELARIRREAAAEDRQSARDEVTTHRLATQEILTAEHGLVRGIIGGRQSMTQIAANLIDNLVEKEIDADLQYLTKHLLMSKAELAADKTADQAGLLWHTLFTTEKTAKTVVGETAETAAKVAGEGTRTAATVAGEAARATAKSAARAASSAEELASGSAQILNDAYKSAAGAYSAVVGIPIIGPILAPIAAGTAFAAVAAFDSLTSLDVGAWRVPRDMPAYIHEGESVVPKNFAEGLRDHGGLGGTGKQPDVAGAALTYAPTINAPQHKSLEQLLYSESSSMIKFINVAIRDGHIMPGGR